MIPEPKPCAHCGKGPVELTIRKVAGVLPFAWIKCLCCGVTITEAVVRVGYDAALTDLVTRWNRRAHDAGTRERTGAVDGE